MKSINNCIFFNDCFLTISEKLRGANQIDKLCQLKKIEHLYIIYFKIVGVPIRILNSGTH